ncbi:hypothetical protein ACSZOA_03625 [Aeromonas caviae]
MNSDYNFLALWGAAVSTILACVKFWEMWRDRYRVETSYRLTSSIIEGNEIYIHNINNRPIIIEHWILEWRKGIWPRIHSNTIKESDYHEGLRISAYSSHTLPFKGDNYFKTGVHKEKGESLYLKLYLADKVGYNLLKVY